MTAQSAPSVVTRKSRRLNPSVMSDQQLAFDEFLDANFYGQPKARKLLRMAYANYLNPLRDKNKPIAFLVFAGESRTGKTHGARMIPAFVHKNEAALLKINCSEYMDKHSLWNLKGSPRGHISNQVSNDEKYNQVPKDQKHGYAELMNHNLEWSKKGSTAPLTVVLLDEWDKACFDFNLLMLQAMDDGQVTLGSGEVVDFRNTIFIAACNSGMQQVENEEKGGIGFNKRETKLDNREVTSIVDKVIKESTPPEFRNRLKELGGVAVFDSLTTEMMKLVVKRDLKTVQEAITASGFFFTLSITDAALDEILRQALANKGNLSNVKSLISTEVQIPLGIEATKGSIKKGDNVIVDIELPLGVTEEEQAKPVDKRFYLEVSDPLGLLIIGAPPAPEPAVVKADGAAGKDNQGKGVNAKDVVAAAAPTVEAKVVAETDKKKDEALDVDRAPAKGLVVLQDFVIVLRAASNEHAVLKEALFKGLASSPLIQIHDDKTSYGETFNIPGVDIKVNVTAVRLMAPIELMFGLKRAIPGLSISIVAGEL